MSTLMDESGVIYDVPDSVWQIRTRRNRHPGAVLFHDPAIDRAQMAQGTDEERIPENIAWRFHVVQPNAMNRLSKPTGFDVTAPRYYPRSVMAALRAAGARGTLRAEDLTALRERIPNLGSS